MKKKLFILILVLFLGLGLFSSSPIIKANNFIDEPISTGLWHDVEFDENYNLYRAFIHLKFYNDGVIETTDPITHLTKFNNTYSFDSGKLSSTRIITKPENFNNFKIDKYVAGIYGNTTNFGNVERVRFELFDDMFSNYKVNVYNDLTNDLLFYGVKLTDTACFYWETDPVAPNYDEDDVIHVGNNYTALPDLKTKFIRIGKISLLDENSKTYRFYYTYLANNYSFDVSIPNEIDMINIYDKDNKINISISNGSDNEKLLYIQPDKDLLPYPNLDGSIDKPSPLQVGFITINLTTLSYETVMPLKLQAIVNKESNKNAYAYMFFNIPIEKIYSIELKYAYQYKYLTSTSDYETITNVFLHDKTIKTKPPFWLRYSSAVVFWPSSFVFNNLNIYKIDQITKITKTNLPNNVVDQFKNDFLGDVKKLDSLGLFKIHLGQFNKFGSLGYNIHEDIAVLNILYLYEGVVYDVPYDKIDQEWRVPPEEKPPLGKGLFKIDFDNFFKFSGVYNLSSFFTHLVKFWLESIIFFGVVYIVIKMVLSLRKYKIQTDLR